MSNTSASIAPAALRALDPGTTGGPFGYREGVYRIVTTTVSIAVESILAVLNTVVKLGLGTTMSLALSQSSGTA
jgi:hypothetical protein